MKEKYENIINMEHPTSRTHTRMPAIDRAAQFAPFAAMVGHDAAVAEVARVTEEKCELDEAEISILNEKLELISMMSCDSKCPVTIKYFKPDERKKGGAYITVSGIFESADLYSRTVVLSKNIKVPIDQIVAISSPLLDEY